MSPRPKIIINPPKIDDKKLTAKVETSKDILRYLWSKELFVYFDEEIYANESILNIPLTATMLPLAWLSGSDIHVRILDREFKESVDKLGGIFSKLYPLAPFKTEIFADKIVDNKIEVKDKSQRTALLFSGGVDSTYSLINNLEKKPRLIMHWGVDGYPYPHRSEYWNKTIESYNEIVNKIGIKLNLIKTNVLEILHNRRIEHDFHQELYSGSLWLRLQFTLILASLIAPLSINRFDRLIVAASHDPNFAHIDTWGPTANEPVTDHEIKWADFSIRQDGYIPRYQKIRSKIREYIYKNNEVTLRVCNNRKKSGNNLNCSSCEKCYRTIVPLIQAEIDPNNCGFQVDELTQEKIQNFFQNTAISPQVLEYQWTPIIKSIKDPLTNDPYVFNDFLRWIKTHQLSSSKKDVWRYRNLYTKLPWTLAKGLDEIYKKIGINIHEHSPIKKEILEE